MNKKIFAVLALLAFAGCFLPKRNIKKASRIRAVKAEKYLLGEPLNYKKELFFRESVKKAYEQANKEYGNLAARGGLIYKLTPIGLVKTFSEVEVECLSGEKLSKKESDKICDAFFSNIENELSALK